MTNAFLPPRRQDTKVTGEDYLIQPHLAMDVYGFNRLSVSWIKILSWRLGDLAVNLVFAVCFFLGSSASAQVLTSGADFLKIDNGARSQGMGGAFTAVADDVNALTWNPAGVALLKAPQVGYLRMLYLSDIAYNFGGVAFPIQAGEDSFGLGAGIVNLGTSFDSTLGIASAVTAGDSAVFLSFAYRIKNAVAIGVSGKYIFRNISGFNAAAFGGDAGILITPGTRFRIGAGIFNVGQSVQFISSADPLPMSVRLGLAYEVVQSPHHSLLLSIDNSYQIQSQTYQYAGGLEYWYDKAVALRGGYTGDSYQQHWAAGIGLNVGNVAEVDYAYAPIGTLGDTHRLSIIFKLGAEAAEGLLAPPSFAASTFDGGVVLNWKRAPSPDVVGYNLYLRRPGAENFSRLTSHPTGETTVRLKKLTNGLNYTFAVASVSAAGRESPMAQLTARPEAAAVIAAPILQPPTGFKVVASGEGLLITWDKASLPDVGGANLYLADDLGKPAQKLSFQPVTDGQVVIRKVSPDRTYRFVLTAVSKAGVESAPTAVFVAKLSNLQQPTLASLLPPSQLTAEPGDGFIRLSWNEAKGAVGFNIYTSDDGVNYRRLNKLEPVKTQKVQLKPLHNGKKYYFGVTSVSADGKESEKTIQQGVPAAAPTK